MKIIGKTLLVLLSAIIVLALVAFLLPRYAHVERTAQIDAPARMVFAQVNDLHQWNEWATWNQIDPEMKIEYQHGGIDQGAGYSWESANKQVGKGSLTLTASVPYDSIAISMDFMEGGLANSYFIFKEDSSKTTVTWAFNSDLGNNPLSRWLGLMFKQMIGADFEKGLTNLSQLCQNIKEEEIPVVEIVQLPETAYASINQKVSWEDVGNEMSVMLQKINAMLQKESIAATDMPFCIYHSVGENEMQIECGIPVGGMFEPKEGVSCQTRKAGKYALAYHIGSYELLETTHSAIQNWIKEHQLNVNGAPMEIYLTDTSSQTDPNKWVTAVCYPL